MKNMVVAVVITYNPEMERFKKNIESLVPQVDRIIIVDNGSKNVDSIEDTFYFHKICVIKLKQNVGIAKAQNIGFKEASLLDAKWVLTMDQDSILAHNSVQEMLLTKEAGQNTTGILTPRYIDMNWTDSQRKNEDLKISGNVQEMETVISSGNLVSMEAWCAVGGFDEWLFIDQVDLDFNKRLDLAKFKIYQVNTIEMKHEIGEIINRPFFQRIIGFSKDKVFSDHSPMRQYYIFRNRIVFWRRYPEVRDNKAYLRGSITGSRHILLFPQKKIKKLFSAWRGIKEAWSYDPEKDVHFQELKGRALNYGNDRKNKY